MPSCLNYFILGSAILGLVSLVLMKPQPFKNISTYGPDKELLKQISLMLILNSQIIILSATVYSFAFLPENANNDFYLFGQKVNDPVTLWYMQTSLGVILYGLGIWLYKKLSSFYGSQISFSWVTNAILLLIPVFSSIISIFSIVDSLINAN